MLSVHWVTYTLDLRVNIIFSSIGSPTTELYRWPWTLQEQPCICPCSRWDLITSKACRCWKKIVDGSRFFMISAFSRSRLNCCVTYAEADSLIIQILPLCFPSTISEYQMQHFVFYFSFSKHKCAPDKKKLGRWH